MFSNVCEKHATNIEHGDEENIKHADEEASNMERMIGSANLTTNFPKYARQEAGRRRSIKHADGDTSNMEMKKIKSDQVFLVVFPISIYFQVF